MYIDSQEQLKAKYIEDVTSTYLPHFEALVTNQGCFLGDKVVSPVFVIVENTDFSRQHLIINNRSWSELQK